VPATAQQMLQPILSAGAEPVKGWRHSWADAVPFLVQASSFYSAKRGERNEQTNTTPLNAT
jgi:hypothetical protein